MTKQLLRSPSTKSLLVIGALTIALTPQALRAQCPAQNATMNGTYVTSGTGSIPGVGPIATIGVVTYDGQGGGVLGA